MRPPEHAKKYPRTPHLPWSPGFGGDDVRIKGQLPFEGHEVVITEKMDGENTTMYRDYIHARSLDSRHHASRSWVKGLHRQVAHLIPDGWRVCGENLYARHALHYTSLPTYFMVFSIWNDEDMALGWDETREWCEMLGLMTAPVLWRGNWDEDHVRALSVDTHTQEGFVVRLARGFHRDNFTESMAKWVRQGHVNKDDTHWMYAEVIPNVLTHPESE